MERARDEAGISLLQAYVTVEMSHIWKLFQTDSSEHLSGGCKQKLPKHYELHVNILNDVWNISL